MALTLSPVVTINLTLHSTMSGRVQPDHRAFAAQYMLVTGEALMTERQRNWRDIVRLSRAVRPVPRIRRPLQRFRVRDCGMCHPMIVATATGDGIGVQPPA